MKKANALQNTLVISDKIYTPISLIPNVDSVKEEYTKHFYIDANCRKCEYRIDKRGSQPGPMCESCESHTDVVKLWSRSSFDGCDYLALPLGDKRAYERKTGVLFSEVKIRDERVRAPFQYPIKFTGKLYDYQQTMVDAWLSKKYGLIEAPPRTGKTLTMLYICLQLGQRVLLLASQHEFLDQFLDHIHGNPKEGIPKCTNLPELEKKYKKKLYGYPKTDEDYENFQFMVSTPNQFYSKTNGDKRFNLVVMNCGTLAMDEVHKCAAHEFARVVSRFPSLYRIGVSATIDRKDGKSVIIRNVIGPVTARSKRESMTPRVYVHETGFVSKRRYAGGPASWVYAMQALSKDKKRNALIVQHVIKDLKNGHNIVIPITFRAHAAELERLINEAWGSRICKTFLGGGGARNKLERKDVLTDVKANKVRVTIGMRSLIQLGLNVPSWSSIFEIIPIANKPNLLQETSRIRTPVEGKRTPIIRFFVDEGLGQSWGCARQCLTHVTEFGYSFSKLPEQVALVKYMKSQTRYGRSQDQDPGDDSSEYKATRLVTSRPRPTAPKLFNRRL